MKQKFSYIFIFSIFAFMAQAQSVKSQYQMNLRGIEYESLILYDNGTFKLTNEYDLYFETFGNYEIIDNYLFLTDEKLYENDSNVNPQQTDVPLDKKVFKMNNDEIIIVKNGKLKRRIFDKSLTKGLSNFIGHKYSYRRI